MPNRLQDQMVSFAPEDGFIAVQLEPPRDPNGLVTRQSVPQTASAF